MATTPPQPHSMQGTTTAEKDNVLSASASGSQYAQPGLTALPGQAAVNRYDYGHNPNEHLHNDHHEARLPAFGGEFQPGLYRSFEQRKFANPAPLGLCAFALTTFVLSAINMNARNVNVPNVVVPLAFGYGGLVQLCAGMWEMAVGNTFGATALSSYGGFWIAYAVLLTPNWNILADSGPYHSTAATAIDAKMSNSAVGLFLTGWFIFTTILLLLTLRSTVAFFLLFFTLDLAFLMLATGEFALNENKADAGKRLTQAGGAFGMLAAFLAWYNAFAGMADSSNSFFIIPVFHFPWSEKGREARAQSPHGHGHHHHLNLRGKNERETV